MRKSYRLWLTIMSAFVLFAVFGLSKVSAKAAPVSYIDADGNTQSIDENDVNVVGADVASTGLTAGWWIVSPNAIINAQGLVSVSGDVHLILGDGCTFESSVGLILSGENTNLTIYAQTLDKTNAGVIIANSQTPGAAIGSAYKGKCGNITINGGVITANTSQVKMGDLLGYGPGAAIGSGAGGSCGIITINGGKVNVNSNLANGCNGAGIGSGYIDNGISGDCAGVVINGGEVYAKSQYGAAIGSAHKGHCGYVEVNGGEIDAESVHGAAIGSGYETDVLDTITINGGKINAVSNMGAAIGSGDSTDCGTITINGGQITAMTGNKGIGAGYGRSMATNATITIGYTDPDADFIKAYSYEDGATIKEGCFFITEGEEEDKEVTSLSDAAGKKIVPYPIKVEYCTVSLDSTLGVNMYLRLPGDINNYKGDYMSFTINDGSRFSRKVEVVEFNKSNSEVYNGRIYYSFTCPVYVPEMADQIDATFHHGNQPILTAKYSVKQYIDDYIEDRGGIDAVTLSSEGKLVLALGDYGHFTQQMLKTTKKWTDGDHTEMPVVWNNSPKDTTFFANIDLQSYQMEREINDPLEKATMSIVTDEDVALKFYLTAEQGSIPSVVVKKGTTVLTKGTDYTLEEPTSGSTWVVRIGGINALQLGDKYNVEVGGLDCYEDASVMGYVYSMTQSTKYATNNEVQNAVAALAIYYDCAMDYRY